MCPWPSKSSAARRKGDIPGVYAFASPLNKTATGPLSNFARLFDSPAYKPLLGHHKAESLRRIQLTAETYAEVGVGVHPPPGNV